MNLNTFLKFPRPGLHVGDGVVPPMNATPRDLLGETLHHEPRSTESDPSAESNREREREPRRERYTFASGARPLEGFTIKRAIGRGGFGEVYYATSDAGKEVALKLITRNIEIERRGVSQCMNLKCPNLIAIHDLRTTDDGDTFVIMEYVAGPSLANVLANHPNGLPLPDVRAWLKGMVDGVAYLHDHGVVHRDLKPANMFMEEGVVKIGDYGLSKSITMSQDRGHSESIGTCHYMAPEISSGKYHKPIDIYALGVVLYEMVSGRVPFEGETVQEVLMKHLTSRPDLTGLPEPFRSLVARALAKDPNHRPISPYELLPAEDVPRGFSAPPRPDQNAANARQDDGILRIGAEESVFYIGPNTLPPRPTRSEVRRKFLRIWNETRPSVRQVFASSPVRRTPTPLPTPPPPPPLPKARERTAELAMSMIAAAPLALLAPVASNAIFHLVPMRGDGMLNVFWLCMATLLGTWGVMVSSKIMEGRTIGGGPKRLLFLTIGVVLAALTLLIGDFHGRDAEVRAPFAAAIGLAFAGTNWWGLTARDRSKRFRFAPSIFSSLIGIVLVNLFDHTFARQPLFLGLLMIAPIASIVAQLVSPRNAQAAEYATAMRRLRRSKMSA